VALVVTVLVGLSGALGAVLTGSLALLADLGHQITDVAALAAALVATRIVTVSHDADHTCAPMHVARSVDRSSTAVRRAPPTIPA